MVIVEVYWLHMLFKELDVPLPTIPLSWCNNRGALTLASNPMFHAWTKHIEVDVQFVQEKVINKDIFTKGLSSPQFLFLRDKLMVLESHIHLQGIVNRISKTLQHAIQIP